MPEWNPSNPAVQEAEDFGNVPPPEHEQRKVVCADCRKRIPTNPTLVNMWWATRKDTSQERVCKTCYFKGGKPV